MNTNSSNKVLSFCLGLVLSVPACGAQSSAVESAAIGNQSRALSTSETARSGVHGPGLSPVDLPPPDGCSGRYCGGGDGEGGGGGGGGGGASTVSCDGMAGGGMDLARFKQLAGINIDRCNDAVSEAEGKSELRYSLSNNLITCGAYLWGYQNGYFAALDRSNHIIAVCKWGCFEAKTLLLTATGSGSTKWTPAGQIEPGTELASLDETSSLSRPVFKPKAMKAMTHGAESPPLYVFELDNGRRLKVTQHHGMLLSNGRVIPAKNVPVGSKFVALDGSIVRVDRISFESTKDEVFNFEVDAEGKEGHFIAAEGVLVGDLAWQNQLAHELGSITLRR